MSVNARPFKKSGIAALVAAAAISGLTALPAHADTSSSIVAAAQGQLGHGAGSGYSGSPNQHSSANGQAWCADFAAWAWAQGGGVKYLSELTDAAPSFYDYGVRHGTLSSTPHPGDAVVFDYNVATDWAKHVEIITAVSGGRITAIGGNENSLVQQDTFSSSVGTSTYNGTISGYISPVTSDTGPAPSVPAPVVIRGDKGSVLGTDGTDMTFTRTATNGHLQLTYLTTAGAWSTTDLSSAAGTPASAGGAPAAFVQQDGTLGAVTGNAANGHVQLTYRAPSGTWATTDLTSYVGTPVTDGKISAITDPDGTLAIYSRDSANGHLQLTYLTSTGTWATTDLTTTVGTPTSAGGAPAGFAMNNGTIGAITADSANGHLRLTYRVPSGTWATTDLTSYVGTPVTDGKVSVMTNSDGTLAIYSRDSADNHLQLTYIAVTTGAWATTDLSASPGTPASAGDSPALFQQKDGTFGAVTADSANGHLRLTYRAPSGTWTTTDLTSYVGTPATDGANPSAVVQNDGTLAIYSHNTANGHLQLTYRAPSGTWTTTDLTTTVGTPAQ